MADSRTLKSEPSGDAYLALLAFAENRAAAFSLVWREQLRFGASADAIEAGLRPFLQREAKASEWPGTTLVGHLAIVRFYRLAPESIAILASAQRLYAWTAPERPEDLAFYAPDGHCWLASISHERDAFVDLDAPALSALSAAVPTLDLSD